MDWGRADKELEKRYPAPGRAMSWLAGIDAKKERERKERGKGYENIVENQGTENETNAE